MDHTRLKVEVSLGSTFTEEGLKSDKNASSDVWLSCIVGNVGFDEKIRTKKMISLVLLRSFNAYLLY